MYQLGGFFIAKGGEIMSEQSGIEVQAQRPIPEIEIGGGDPLRITAFEEIATNTQTGNAEIRQLPDDALQQATDQLKGLPFAVGNKDFIGTPGMRNKHDVVVRVGDRDNAPEDEKGKHTMYFRFGETAGQYGLHLRTHKDLTMEQRRDQDGKISNIVRFSPDQPLKVAGKEVREVALVMPVEPPKPKA